MADAGNASAFKYSRTLIAAREDLKAKKCPGNTRSYKAIVALVQNYQLDRPVHWLLLVNLISGVIVAFLSLAARLRGN